MTKEQKDLIEYLSTPKDCTVEFFMRRYGFTEGQVIGLVTFMREEGHPIELVSDMQSIATGGPYVDSKKFIVEWYGE